MWYLESGELKGISDKAGMLEAFADIFDAQVNQKGGRYPDLGILIAGSQFGFNFEESNTVFLVTEWALWRIGKFPKSIESVDPSPEIIKYLMSGQHTFEQVVEVVRAPQDAVLNDNCIDAPNSRENWWDDVIEVPDDYKWPEDDAGGDASLLGT